MDQLQVENGGHNQSGQDDHNETQSHKTIQKKADEQLGFCTGQCAANGFYPTPMLKQVEQQGEPDCQAKPFVEGITGDLRFKCQ